MKSVEGEQARAEQRASLGQAPVVLGTMALESEDALAEDGLGIVGALEIEEKTARVGEGAREVRVPLGKANTANVKGAAMEGEGLLCIGRSEQAGELVVDHCRIGVILAEGGRTDFQGAPTLLLGAGAIPARLEHAREVLKSRRDFEVVGTEGVLADAQSAGDEILGGFEVNAPKREQAQAVVAGGDLRVILSEQLDADAQGAFELALGLLISPQGAEAISKGHADGCLELGPVGKGDGDPGFGLVQQLGDRDG